MKYDRRRQARHTSGSARTPSRTPDAGPPQILLNGYEIGFPQGFGLPVNTYVLQPTSAGTTPAHAGRGDIVSAMWDYWRENKHHCNGRDRFVLDVGADRVAVPAGWQLPNCHEFVGYSINEETSYSAIPADPEHHAVLCRAIQDSIKKALRDGSSDVLGPLWRCFGDYCQMPFSKSASDFQFCRRFILQPVVLRGNRFVVRIVIRTASIDGRALDYYYREGKVGELADMIEAKRSDRMDRKGNPVGIYVWCDRSTPYSSAAELLEIAEPDRVLHHADLTVIEQRRLASGDIPCREFKKSPQPVSLSKLRLVLHTDITTDQHRETIIGPGERCALQSGVRDLIAQFTLGGHCLSLSSQLVEIDQTDIIDVKPPAVRVMGEWGQAKVLAAPQTVSYDLLRDRARQRLAAIERFGFMRSHPINPAIAWPRLLPDSRAQRMRSDVNFMLRRRGIKYTFRLLRYADVEDLRRQLTNGNHDAVLVVLPEHSSCSGRPNDTHEQVKQRLEIPSKCIHYDNTLPEDLVSVRPSEFSEEARAIAKRIRGQYRLTLDHLLVRHGWMPFEPAEPYHFNVHVGLDVGGHRNDTVVACLGCGFAGRNVPLSFFVHRIPIAVGKAEPIPTDSLYAGLLQLFDQVRVELEETGGALDLSSVLFMRDGAMLGNGDAWNEYDALHRLHATLQAQGRVPGLSRWAVAEIHKRAGEWRIFERTDGAVRNPLVGRCIYGFQNPNEGLLATTGRPYLTQGTAQVLKIVAHPLVGESSFAEAVRDVAWESDMGLTRPDMGRSLPWVLHVADACALQSAKGYKLIGMMA